MDFGLTQDQQDLRSLAARIFQDHAPPDALPDFEEPADWFNERLWAALAESSLLGVGIPEALGGAGLGLVETCVLLEESGRTLAPVPLLPALLLGTAPIVEFGTDAQKKALLPGCASGRVLTTAALIDTGERSPWATTTTAARDGSRWRLDGTKDFVPAASRASHVLVPAKPDAESIAIFLVERSSRGITLEPQATTTGELEYRMVLEGVEVEDGWRLGAELDGGFILRWIVERALAGLCAVELGLADRALRMTAEYTANRKQFGKPIATFQAVAQRAADAYIDLEAMRLATQQAVWRLAEGLPASRELSIAKYWTAEGGHRVCYAAQHLHGGIGVDTDYPLHHYYLRSRHLELTLGGAHTHLAALGDALAAT